MEKTKKVTITKDTSVEQVIEWDKEGMTLVWDVDDFKQLSAAQLKPLSKANRDRYVVFAEIAKDNDDRNPADDDVAYDVQVGPNAGSATDRLAVAKTREGYHHRWERPDMVHVRREQGWKMAGKGYETLRSSGGSHRIGSKGHEELVLMEVPDATYEKMQAAKRQRRERALAGVANQAKSEMERLGGQPIDDSSKADFHPISQQEVSNG